MSFDIRPLSDAIGAEIIGLDAGQPLDDAVFAAIHKAHLDHQVLVFRGQSLTPQQQIHFSKRFGPLDAHPTQATNHPDGYPEILTVSTRTENGKDVGLRNAGPQWHSDLAYRERPALGSMLYALELPDSGGNTGFANMIAAYDALPAPLRNAIDGKRAIFSSKREGTERPHPAIRTHPETGAKSIFVNPQLTTGIEGMDDADAAALLADLYAHCAEERFIYWHRWEPGDLVFWDNRCVLHIADHSRLDDPTYIRHMHRTTIAGDVPY